MNISNEKIAVIFGSVTKEKVVSIMQGTYAAPYRNQIKKEVKVVSEDVYSVKLTEHVTMMATVTMLTKSGMYAQITTFNVSH